MRGLRMSNSRSDDQFDRCGRMSIEEACQLLSRLYSPWYSDTEMAMEDRQYKRRLQDQQTVEGLREDDDDDEARRLSCSAVSSAAGTWRHQLHVCGIQDASCWSSLCNANAAYNAIPE